MKDGRFMVQADRSLATAVLNSHPSFLEMVPGSTSGGGAHRHVWKQQNRELSWPRQLSPLWSSCFRQGAGTLRWLKGRGVCFAALSWTWPRIPHLSLSSNVYTLSPSPQGTAGARRAQAAWPSQHSAPHGPSPNLCWGSTHHLGCLYSIAWLGLLLLISSPIFSPAG